MSALVILIILIVVALLSGRTRNFKIIYMKKLLLPAACLGLILCLIFFSKPAMEAAQNGIQLWLNVVFPSLFPFFVAAELLTSTGFIKSAGVLFEPVMRPLFNVPGSGSFAFLMGITSGYPVGAKITASLREQKLITRTEGARLLAFTNNSGPLFIAGAVATGMLKQPQLGIFLILCHVAASITVGFLFRFYGQSSQQHTAVPKKSFSQRVKWEFREFAHKGKLNLGAAFGEAIRNSVLTILSIGGFIIFFSVIIRLLIVVGFISWVSQAVAPLSSAIGITPALVSSMASGFFEITTGISMAAGISSISFPLQLAVVSLIMGWGGLSVHSQVYSIMSQTDISIRPYLSAKALQGLMAAVYTWIGIKTAGGYLLRTAPAFSPLLPGNEAHWFINFRFSLLILLAGFLLLLLGMLILRVCKHFRHRQQNLSI